MTIKEMLQKKNRPFTFRQFPPPLMGAFLKRMAFVVALLAVTGYMVYFMSASSVSTQLTVLLLPAALFVFFAVSAAHAYLIAATGTYQIIEGTCIESPNTPEVKSFFKRRASSLLNPVKKMTCVVHGTDGEYYRILCTTTRHLPRQGNWTVLYCPISRQKPETLDSGEIQILSYLSIQSYVKRKKEDLPDPEPENT
jgi:hypothetical protein